jgi:hypothetical protein
MRSRREDYTGRIGSYHGELAFLVAALNGNFEWEVLTRGDSLGQEPRITQTPPLLRKLVQAWQLSGPDLDKFSADQPKMWADVERYWKTMRQNPIHLIGAPGGGAFLFMNSSPENDPCDEALRWFIELLLNPDCVKLAGPCPRCDNYYIRRSARNKVYCSRSCGTSATAIAATRKRRHQEHADKLLRADQAGREWVRSHMKKDWKSWVSRRHPDISVKFMTRSVNSGELKPPTKGKQP